MLIKSTIHAKDSNLYIFIHGLMGHSYNFKSMMKRLAETTHDSLLFAPEANSGRKSNKGIKQCTLNLWDEFHALWKEHDSIESISIIGHSFGGILARELAHRMSREKVFAKLSPKIFMTIASPHIGARNFMKKRIDRWANLSQTTKELSLTDEDQILVKMCDGAHLGALERFEKRILYGNVRNDSVVSYITSMISKYKNPFTGKKMREGIMHVDDTLKLVPAEFKIDPKKTDLDFMLERLNLVEWERNFVFLRGVAHAKIIMCGFLGNHEVAEQILSQLKNLNDV